jgi:ketosteroid isomerase-like protein
MMPEEAATPNLVELVVAFFEATNRRDLEARMSFFAPEAVWDLSPMGLGTFEGRAAMREMWVYVLAWVEGMVARVIPYGDIDQARAAAERLTEERG